MFDRQNSEPGTKRGGLGRIVFGPGLRISTLRQALLPGGVRGLPATMASVVRYALTKHVVDDHTDDLDVDELRAAAIMWCLLAGMGLAITASAVWYGPIYLAPGLATGIPGVFAATITTRRLMRAEGAGKK